MQDNTRGDKSFESFHCHFKTLICPLLMIHCPLLYCPPGLLQVQQSLEKITRLEQEKEHWLLEAQLGKVRLEKENQRIAELEIQLAAALGGNLNLQTSGGSVSDLSNEETTSTTEQKTTAKETTLCTSLVQFLFCLNLCNL